MVAQQKLNIDFPMTPLLYSTYIRILVALLLYASTNLANSAPTIELDAPNLVVVTPRIITSGQPTAKALASLGKQGFDAVIFLVPDGISSNVTDEAAILKNQGIPYIHIPIPFGQPNATHYTAFASAMSGLTNKKVLVHCEINLRASSMVFLYRTIALKEDPQRAFESVAKVWSPRGAWKPFIQEMLSKSAITFEPY
jgi:protein tyrosine phosphatase (PTP) superfamily phosphohydrolase (DUF442 family)